MARSPVHVGGLCFINSIYSCGIFLISVRQRLMNLPDAPYTWITCLQKKPSHGAFGYEKVLHLLRTFFHRISCSHKAAPRKNRGRSESLRVGEDVIGAMTFECHSGNVLPHGCCVFFGERYLVSYQLSLYFPLRNKRLHKALLRNNG